MAKIFSVMRYELLPGITEVEYEAFVGSPANRALNRPGITFHMLKGDRGERKGKYGLLLEFDSVEARNRIFPVEGEGTADEVLAAKLQPFFEGMGKLVDNDWKWTDYVDID